MKYLQNIMGAVTQAFKFDGTNYVDVFPIKANDANNANRPTDNNFTFGGITYRAEFWSIGDLQGLEYEINHNYKNNGTCKLHARVFPTTDAAGDFEFQYQFIINSIDVPTGVISTRAGATATLSGTFAANDFTNGKGVYATVDIDGDALNLQSGEMLQGNFVRNSDTYAPDVVVAEIGLHIPVGKTGDNFGG